MLFMQFFLILKRKNVEYFSASWKLNYENFTLHAYFPKDQFQEYYFGASVLFVLLRLTSIGTTPEIPFLCKRGIGLAYFRSKKLYIYNKI